MNIVPTVLNFSWDNCNTQEKWKTKVMQNFGGQTGCITGDVQMMNSTFALSEVNLCGNSLGKYAQNTSKCFESDKYMACVLTNYFHRWQIYSDFWIIGGARLLIVFILAITFLNVRTISRTLPGIT